MEDLTIDSAIRSDDSAFFERIDLESSGKWVFGRASMGDQETKLPTLFAQYAAIKSLRVFIESVLKSMEATGALKEITGGEDEFFLTEREASYYEAFIEAEAALGLLARACSVMNEPIPHEDIQETVRILHRYLPPNYIATMERQSDPLISDDFQAVRQELYAEDEAGRIGGAFARDELKPTEKGEGGL